jgi:hypothetical protein
MGATLKRREGSGLVLRGFEADFGNILAYVFLTIYGRFQPFSQSEW